MIGEYGSADVVVNVLRGHLQRTQMTEADNKQSMTRNLGDDGRGQDASSSVDCVKYQKVQSREMVAWVCRIDGLECPELVGPRPRAPAHEQLCRIWLLTAMRMTEAVWKRRQ